MTARTIHVGTKIRTSCPSGCTGKVFPGAVGSPLRGQVRDGASPCWMGRGRRLLNPRGLGDSGDNPQLLWASQPPYLSASLPPCLPASQPPSFPASQPPSHPASCLPASQPLCLPASWPNSSVPDWRGLGGNTYHLVRPSLCAPCPPSQHIADHACLIPRPHHEVGPIVPVLQRQELKLRADPASQGHIHAVGKEQSGVNAAGICGVFPPGHQFPSGQKPGGRGLAFPACVFV